MTKNYFIFILLVFLINAQTGTKTPVEITGEHGGKSKLIGIENGEKIYLTELSNPVITYNNSELRADNLITYSKNHGIVEVVGNVRMIDKKNNSRINSDKAVYYKEDNIVEFTGKPRARLKREDDNSIVDIQANIIKYDIDTKIAEASGNIRLKNNDLNIFSEKAIFKRDEKTAIFSESPEIKRGDEVYNAEEIFYYTDRKRMVLNKNAHVKTFSEEKDQETNKIKRIEVNASGDRIEHFDNNEQITIIKGNAVIEREDAVFTGETFKMEGEENREILTGSDVHIDYKIENMEAFGENFKSFRKTGYSALWGNACMVFKDEQTKEETSRVYGNYMEYYQDIDEVYISGNVDIIQKDGNIKGNIARYQRQSYIMTVTGNARLEKEDSQVLSQSITINTKTNETRLNGDIRGRGIN